MKIHFTCSYIGIYHLIAVLYNKDIEAKRETFLLPLTGHRFSFDVLPGKYDIRVFESRNGFSLDLLLHNFWVNTVPAKLPRILKCRK